LGKAKLYPWRKKKYIILKRNILERDQSDKKRSLSLYPGPSEPAASPATSKREYFLLH
jgi:hypothetical protein